jgi:signal transduction histidine kinase
MFNSLTRQIVTLVAALLLANAMTTSALTAAAIVTGQPAPQVIAHTVVINAAGAVLCAMVTGFFVRGRLRQLWRLTKAARAMGQGDLNTPIQTTASAPEIVTLAQTLEKSRHRLLEMLDETRRRHEVQSYFLSNMSHEFRTPLSGMKVSIALLQEGARNLSAAERDELIASLDMSVTTMQRLIDNLLESGRIESRRFSLQPRPCALEPIIAEAVQVMQPLLSRRQQTLFYDAPLTLPPLRADPTRLIQVLVNLLANASKYSPMNARIDLLVTDQPGGLTIAVADRGEGVPVERREGIFKRFERLENAAEADYGVGLGLSVVKAIIEGHAGQVGVEGRPGGGSTFWFTLPLTPERASPGVQPAPLPLPALASPKQGGHS